MADEVFGPWDRTGEPYNYPPTQRELMEKHKEAWPRICDETRDLANGLFDELAGAEGSGTGVVIAKHPHLKPSPEEWARAFPDDPKVYLIRNPLHRLNSLHARGWTASFGPSQDLDRFKQFAAWWRQQPHRLAYDDLKADAHAFFRRLFEAWDLAHEPADVERAVAYTRGHYHASSKVLGERSPEAGVLSEKRFALPAEAFDLYLKDPFIVELMEEMGWSMDPDDYGGVAERGGTGEGASRPA